MPEMIPPQSPSDPSPLPESPVPEDEEFEAAVAEIERSLQQLKERYTQVQQDIQQQTELKLRQKQLKKQARRHPQLHAELAEVAQQLEHLAVSLESSLDKDSFWQAVRFGGLGIILGWLLKSCAG
jgi:molecular chaperone GrpE (heat shock protein)